MIWKIDLGRMVEAMGQVSLPWLALAVGTKVGVIAVKAMRWSLVISDPLGRRPRGILRATYLGYFGNAVLPLKLGELARIQLCRRHNDLGFSQVVGTMVVERSLDILSLLLLFAVAAPLFPLPDWAGRAALPVAGAAVLGVGALVWMALRGLQLPEAVLPGGVGATLLRRVNGIIAGFSSGLSSVRSPGLMVLLSSITLGIWLSDATGTWFALLAFGLTPGWGAALVLMVIVTLGLAVPSAPAGMGTHQFLYILILGTFGVSPEAATAVSVTLVVTMVGSLTLIGLPIMWYEGLTFKTLREEGAPETG